MTTIRKIIERAARGNNLILHGIGWYLLAMGETGKERAKAVVARLIGWGILIWLLSTMLAVLGAFMWTASGTWFTACLIAPSFLGEEAPEDEVSEPVEQDDEYIDIIQALHEAGGGKSVHLSTVAAHLNLQLGDVHSLLKEADIPTRHSVKVNGDVAVGVHHTDLPPLPSPTLDIKEGRVAGSAAGQSATATATTWELHETPNGAEAWFQDPFNPVRTHIVRLDKEAS